VFLERAADVAAHPLWSICHAKSSTSELFWVALQRESGPEGRDRL